MKSEFGILIPTLNFISSSITVRAKNSVAHCDAVESTLRTYWGYPPCRDFCGIVVCVLDLPSLSWVMEACRCLVALLDLPTLEGPYCGTVEGPFCVHCQIFLWGKSSFYRCGDGIWSDHAFVFDVYFNWFTEFAFNWFRFNVWIGVKTATKMLLWNSRWQCLIIIVWWISVCLIESIFTS